MAITSSRPAARRSGLLSFPNPVDERAARTVATGVVAMALAILVLGQWWVLVPLAYGFVARVASGPRFSPLGLLATRVVAPRLPFAPKYCAGPPKRFAQAIGAVCSVSALVLHYVVGADTAALAVLGVLTIAASLEAFIGFCLGCWMFAKLMRWGFIPDDVCEECNDISRRLAA
ncbi:MAG: hypothetical protein RL531_332 [Actinomycetota bacterium]|jgi:hypothetical protein